MSHEQDPPDTLTPSLFGDEPRTPECPTTVYYLDGRARLAPENPFSRGSLALAFESREHERENMDPTTDAQEAEALEAIDRLKRDEPFQLEIGLVSNAENAAQIEGIRALHKDWPATDNGADSLTFVEQLGDLRALSIQPVDAGGAPLQDAVDIDPATHAFSIRHVFRGVFWATPDGELIIVNGDKAVKVAGEREGYDFESDEWAQALYARNLRQGHQPPFMLPEGGTLDPKEGEGRPRNDRLSPLPATNAFESSRLIQGVASNLSKLINWTQKGDDRQESRTIGKKKRFTVTTELPRATWDALASYKSASVLKSFWALEAQRHTQGDPYGTFLVTPEWLAREMSHDRASGKITSAEKEKSLQFVRAMMQMRCAYTFIGRDDKAYSVSGPYYHEVGTMESEDLFGYVPSAIALRFNSELHGRSNQTHLRQRLHFYRSFLGLDANKDSLAIHLGSYVMLKGRNQSHQFEPGEGRFTNRSLVLVLIQAGEIDIERVKRRREWGTIPQRVENAMNKLVEVGAFASWGYTRPDDVPEVNMDEDDPEAFASAIDELQGAKLSTTFEAWQAKTTRVTFGGEEVARQLESRDAKAAAIAVVKKRRGRPPKATTANAE